jgi:hypothetical protein
MSNELNSWYCPLYQNEISAGRCVEINLERLHFLNGTALQDLAGSTGKREPEVSSTCEHCPNMPLERRGEETVLGPY